MERSSERFNIIISLLTVAMIMAVAAFFGDYYFDLNDDVLMKDILSGAYTGYPEANNIQMLYPISGFIALFYKVYSGFDWYGIFLCFLQYLCVFVISHALISRCRDNASRLITFFAMFMFMAGVIGAHFIFVQYTFTCGLLSATAAILVLTHEENDRRLYLAVALIATAYLLRSEMLLLTLPVVGVAILIKWALTGEEFKNYVFVCLGILGAIVVGQGIHRIANSPEEWKVFNHLFDERTELYDFQYIPDYEENKEFYDSIGLSKSEQQLLVNYNFGLDDEIDADILNAVADYAASIRTDEKPMGQQLKEGVVLYLYRLRHFAYQKSYQYPMSDFPWNIIALLLYISAFLTYLLPLETINKKELLIATGLLLTLFACRTTLWMYIIVRGRDPIRITHPLYLMEIVALLGMMFIRIEKSSKVPVAALLAVAAISLVSVPNQVSVSENEMNSRSIMREHYDALYDYFDENEDNFYFIDVYTSVSCGEDMEEDETTFSEKMFDWVDNSFANHDLMGGWASKSPLYYKKLKNAGLDNMQDALLKKNVFMVQNLSGDTQWIKDYYKEKGIEVSVNKVDTVADAFAIYSITKGAGN